MTNEYKAYLLTEIEKANEAWKKAIEENRFDDACIFGKRVSDIEAIYYYHSRQVEA